MKTPNFAIECAPCPTGRRISRMHIRNVWMAGDPAALLSQPA